jgi:hypothetical protein
LSFFFPDSKKLTKLFDVIVRRNNIYEELGLFGLTSLNLSTDIKMCTSVWECFWKGNNLWHVRTLFSAKYNLWKQLIVYINDWLYFIFCYRNNDLYFKCLIKLFIQAWLKCMSSITKSITKSLLETIMWCWQTVSAYENNL